jgi:hypothetical protein
MVNSESRVMIFFQKHNMFLAWIHRYRGESVKSKILLTFMHTLFELGIKEKLPKIA